MSKKYNKPILQIEYFALSQSVALGCGAPHWDEMMGGPAHWSKKTCGWRDDLGTVYWLDTTICETETPIDYSPIEGVCYNEPNGGYPVFSS